MMMFLNLRRVIHYITTVDGYPYPSLLVKPFVFNVNFGENLILFSHVKWHILFLGMLVSLNKWSMLNTLTQNSAISSLAQRTTWVLS